jgi:uncharacterized protein (DUF4415 family)
MSVESSRLGERPLMSDGSTGKKPATGTDWDVLRKMTEQEIRAGIAEDSDIVPTDEEFWRGARVVVPRARKRVTLRLDRDIAEWLQRNVQTEDQLNALLREAIKAGDKPHGLREDEVRFAGEEGVEGAVVSDFPRAWRDWRLDFDHPFFEYCETVIRNWWEGNLEPSSVLQMDHIPEPHLPFGSTERPLVFVTLNPGGGFEAQTREAITRFDSPVARALPYRDNARRLARYYRYPNVINDNARHRIEAMISFAARLGFSGVLQLEAIPFHSSALAGSELPKLTQRRDVSEYQTKLRSFLREPPCAIAISAAKAPFSRSTKVRYFADLFGLDVGSFGSIELKSGVSGPTVGALHAKNGEKARVITCRDGHNGLPGRASLERLAAKLID